MFDRTKVVNNVSDFFSAVKIDNFKPEYFDFKNPGAFV